MLHGPRWRSDLQILAPLVASNFVVSSSRNAIWRTCFVLATVSYEWQMYNAAAHVNHYAVSDAKLCKKHHTGGNAGLDWVLQGAGSCAGGALLCTFSF